MVGEGEYHYEPPSSGSIEDMLLLMLRNCADYMRQEGIPIEQDSIKLEKLTLSYLGLAGVIEVVFEGQTNTIYDIKTKNSHDHPTVPNPRTSSQRLRRKEETLPRPQLRPSSRRPHRRTRTARKMVRRSHSHLPLAHILGWRRLLGRVRPNSSPRRRMNSQRVGATPVVARPRRTKLRPRAPIPLSRLRI